MTFEEILEAVKVERARQDEKWGRGFKGRDDSFWLTILAEEFGEVARAIIEYQEVHTAEELIQVAHQQRHDSRRPQASRRRTTAALMGGTFSQH